MENAHTEIIQDERPILSPERLAGVPFELKRITAEKDPDTWIKMGQLRAKSYILENHFLDESHLDENGAEFDEYDDDPRTTHLVVLDGEGEVISTSRTIYREASNLKPLPSEEIFSIDTSNGPAREISRLITDKSRMADDYKRASHLLKLYLIRSMTQEAVSQQDAGPLYAVIEKPLLADLSRVGVTMDLVGEPVFSEKYNSENVLVSFRYNDMTSGMHQADEARIARRPSMKERFGPFMEREKASLGVGRIALASDFVTPPAEQYERNFGWLSREEHERITESEVAIAGVGGDGGALAVQLARMGVAKFRLADPDPFEVENINRQEGATYKTIGRNKAEVIAEIIKDIQPHAEVKVYTDGVTEENVTDFVAGSDLVFDETEYTRHEIGVMIARECRRNSIPEIMALNVGFGSYVTSFDPNKGMTFEEYLGLDNDMPLSEIAKQEVSLAKWIPHIPSYADMSIFPKVASGEVSAPTVSPGVGIAASHAAVQAVAYLVKDISPSRERMIRVAPRGESIDIIDGVNKVRFPTLHFAKTALIASIRTKLKMNPQMHY